MGLNDYLKIIRTRWVTITATTLAVLLCAVAYTVIQTPLYQATTRLFVSTAAGSSVSDLYSGNRLSQERVLSYAQLITGETLAQRTIDRLNLGSSAATLAAKVEAKAKPDTVLIEVSVIDPSPVQARDIANALSEEFVDMVRELETPRPGAIPDARVVVEQRATIPGNPVVPKRTRNIALGLVLGGLIGIGLALVRDLLDNTVKSRDDLEHITGTGVVGVIPFDKDRRSNPAIAFEKESSPTAEALRKLRTNLQFISVDDPPRLIVVASAVPNEGKSTTAINIALVLAEGDHNVLLVDADMRRPSLAKYLDVVGSVGLSTLLSGAASVDEVLQETKFPRLTVVAAGPTPPNPSELLGSLAARNTFGQLRKQFDFVIIDSPPLLAVTDGAILAAQSDGALILVRAGSTKREQLTQAVGILKDVGATLLGAVLTLVPTRGSGGAYGYGYGYGYYNYSESHASDGRDSSPKLDETLPSDKKATDSA